jgi:hypothetical protein
MQLELRCSVGASHPGLASYCRSNLCEHPLRQREFHTPLLTSPNLVIAISFVHSLCLVYNYNECETNHVYFDRDVTVDAVFTKANPNGQETW